jgi:hypothetical protein
MVRGETKTIGNGRSNGVGDRTGEVGLEPSLKRYHPKHKAKMGVGCEDKRDRPRAIVKVAHIRMRTGGERLGVTSAYRP